MRCSWPATKACLHITELALDHPERVLDLHPYLRLGFFDLAPGFVQDAALAQFLVGATPGGNFPDDLATFMLGAFLHSGISHQLVLFQQATEVEDRGFVGGSLLPNQFNSCTHRLTNPTSLTQA